MLVAVGLCLLDDVTCCVGKGTQEGQKTKVKRACVTAKKNMVPHTATVRKTNV